MSIAADLDASAARLLLDDLTGTSRELLILRLQWAHDVMSIYHRELSRLRDEVDRGTGLAARAHGFIFAGEGDEVFLCERVPSRAREELPAEGLFMLERTDGLSESWLAVRWTSENSFEEIAAGCWGAVRAALRLVGADVP